MINPFRASRGITLFELVISLVVISVLITLSVPSFSNLVQARQTKAAVRSLDQGFSTARSEAIKRRAVVTICALNASATCSFDWSQDISIFEDTNEDRALSAGEDLILTINAVKTGKFIVLVSNRNYFQYGPTGTARNTMGSVAFCPNVPSPDGKSLKLVIHLSGRTRVDLVPENSVCSH